MRSQAGHGPRCRAQPCRRPTQPRNSRPGPAPTPLLARRRLQHPLYGGCVPTARKPHAERNVALAELLSVVSDAVRYTAGVSDMRDELTARGGDVSRLPRGEVTFLFGDVERSTQLLARLGDAWSGVLETMRRHVRDARGHTLAKSSTYVPTTAFSFSRALGTRSRRRLTCSADLLPQHGLRLRSSCSGSGCIRADRSSTPAGTSASTSTAPRV